MNDRSRRGQSVVLIGMPGAGKSTCGVILARLLGCGFVDTDVLIQAAQGRMLQDIVDRDGYLTLRDIEEAIITGLAFSDRLVVATGGSAVYSKRAMAHLRDHGTLVFLAAELATLEGRVADYATRGLAKRPDQTLKDLFEERGVLYREYADLTVRCDGLTHEQVCAEVLRNLAGRCC